MFMHFEHLNVQKIYRMHMICKKGYKIYYTL